MFTLLADALYTNLLTRRGGSIPEHFKTHADRHVPQQDRRQYPGAHPHNPFRDLW